MYNIILFISVIALQYCLVNYYLLLVKFLAINNSLRSLYTPRNTHHKEILSANIVDIFTINMIKYYRIKMINLKRMFAKKLT